MINLDDIYFIDTYSRTFPGEDRSRVFEFFGSESCKEDWLLESEPLRRKARVLLDYCRDFFMDYGGHDFAGGFSLNASDIDAFRERLLKFTEEEGIEIPEKPAIEIDAELPEGYFTEAILDVADRMVPYGECNAPLAFFARKLEIKVMDLVGQRNGGHLKFTLDSGKNLWPAIFWNSSDRIKEFKAGDKVNVIFKIENNYFRNKVTPQLVIQDMEIV